MGAPIDPRWRHRLVRAEIDLAQQQIHRFVLRRSRPITQPLLRMLPHHQPRSGWRVTTEY